MSLATRCTACGTVFRVVQDQLRMSDGWVRCGRCKEVFNGLDGVFDLEREAPPEWHGPGSSPALTDDDRAGTQAWTSPSSPMPLPGVPERASEAPASGISFRVSAPTPLPPGYALPPPRDPYTAPPGAALDVDLTNGARSSSGRSTGVSMPGDFDTRPSGPGVDLAIGADAHPGSRSAPARPQDVPDLTDAAPGFVREAQARERWQQPRVRAALAGGIVAMGLLLVAQIGLHYRHDAASRWPGTRPLLELGCAIAGCNVGPPRRLQDVVVESSALTRAGDSPDGDVLRLDVALRNRADIVLAMPTIDLRLTDGNGTLVIRRSLSAADFHHPKDTLEPDSDTPLRLQFTTGDLRITGYTVEIYYP